MNIVTGKILLEVTSGGIPNLLVTIYDVDFATIPEKAFRSNKVTAVANFWDKLQGDRLGSVLTDQQGMFKLEHEDSEFQGSNKEKRPDLVLFVTAPEKQGTESCSPILHVSCGVRQSAGKTESYLIQLSAEKLKEAGVPIPMSPSPGPEVPATIIERLTQEEERNELIDEGMQEIKKGQIDKALARSAQFDEKLKPQLLKALSRFPEEVRQSRGFVAPEEDVEEKTKAMIRHGIENVINSTDPKVRAPLVGQISLTDDQKQLLEPYKQNGNYVNVPGDVAEPILYKKRNARSAGSTLIRDNPIIQFCREKTAGERCLEDDQQDGDGSGPDTATDDTVTPGSTDNGIETVTGDDVPGYIASLMETMTAPEHPPVLEFPEQEQRPNLDAVRAQVEGLKLTGGLADAPAFYDFHNLQIAFEHVWQD